MRTKSAHERIDYFFNVVLRQIPLFYKTYRKNTLSGDIKIIGIMRERNEELLLQDSLDHLAQFVDAIVVFDDASTDRSVEIAKAHPAVVEVVVNRKWRSSNRVWEETSNRQKLFSRAKRYDPEWFFYCDADERFEGDIRHYLLEECPKDVGSVRVSLFDAYLTGNDKKPYSDNKSLYDFRKYFGPERRDILMIWRNHRGASFNVKDAREPQRVDGSVVTRFFCQHYGKSLSIEHWEDTCDYYIQHFPKYSEKWKGRKGKAVHEVSDFGNKLYVWSDVKRNSVDMKSL